MLAMSCEAINQAGMGRIQPAHLKAL